TAVYGSRAANGVIIINTKRGKTEKPTLSFTSNSGIYSWIQRPQMASNERRLEKYGSHVGSDDPMDFLYPNERVNYANGRTYHVPDIISRTGQILDNQLSISGGLDNLNYYLSTGFTDQKGVMIGDDYNRVSLRGRVNSYITDWMQVSVDGSYNRSDYSGIGVPTGTIRYGDTNEEYYRGNPDDGLLEKWPNTERSPGLMPYGMNPLWPTNANPDRVLDDVDLRDFYNLATFAHIDAPFLEGLSYRLNFTRTYRNFQQERLYYEDYFIEGGNADDLDRYSPETIAGFLGQAEGYVRDRKISNYVLDNIVNFRRRFDQHFIDVTLVATRDYQSDRQFQLNGSNFLDNGNTILGIDGMTLATNQINTNNHTEFSNIGYLARLNYTFNDRYHLTSSFRRDASSVFGARNKWGNFPSIGLAWTVTEEDFLSGNDFFNYLKVRTSYGKNGNQGISAYQTLARVAAGSSGGIRYQFGDQPGVSRYGLALTSLGNDLLGWETTTSFNLGFEAALLQERVFVDLDVYFSETVDQLFVRQIPIMTGFGSIRASMGQVDNRGVELSLRTINIDNSDLTWSSHITFWQNRNVLAELYGDGKDDIGNNLFIGESLSPIYGFEWIGIVQEGDTEYMESTGASPGDAKYADLNGDGNITFDDDRKILGYGKENFRLNLSNNLTYGNFELYVHLAGVFGGGDNYYMAQNQGAYLANRPGFVRMEFLDHIDYWTPENPSDTYPSIYYDESRFLGLQSRTFVRVQDVVLSYTFRGDWMNAINIEGLRLNLSGQNLYTFTGWDGEPEMGYGGWDRYYPIPASYSLGFNVTF
ncbi:MAG: SusC/RagA family TonB-linked outer membrane protein, partial [Bacteroidales bacterium]